MNDQNDHDFTGGDLKAAVTGWTPNRRRFLSVAGLAVGGAVVGTTAAGCGTAQTGNTTGGEGEAKGRAGAAGETLFIAGFQWGPPTSFNPFGASPAWPTGGGQSQLIYESLLRFNLLDGSLAGGLAKEIQEPDPNTIVLPLQDGTKWSDGSELTAEDVAFTFDLAKQTALSFSTIWNYVDSIEATDARTVTIKIKADPYNPGFVKNVLATTLIVPKAVWSKIAPDKITADTNLAPIGSGPYKLDKADQTQINLIRDDAYWGKDVFGTPAMTAINHPIFKSNNDGDLKLESGEIDVSQQFTAQIWKMWEDKGAPVGTWLKEKPYYVPGNIPLIIFNLDEEGPGQPEGPPGDRLLDRLREHRQHRHVGLLRRRPTPPSSSRPATSPSTTTPRRSSPRAGSTTRTRPSRSWRASSRPRRAPTASTCCPTAPSWAAGRSSARRAGPTGTRRWRSWPSPPRRSASASPPSSRRPRPGPRRCRTATSTSS